MNPPQFSLRPLGLTALSVSALMAGTPALAQSLPPVPLDHQQATEYLDIRGVGDAGMAQTYKQPLALNQTLSEGVSAHFGERLDALDPTGKTYRGDLSFINWETVVGTRCQRFRGRPSKSSYAFMSHPDNLMEAYRRGFNLIGLANNHSWDCPLGANGAHGALETAQHLERMTQAGNNWLWHGVGKPQQKASAQVKSMVIKGRTVRVAFGSLYLGGACTFITCVQDQNRLLQSLRDAPADLRILSIHSWNKATQQQLVNAGSRFIRQYKGDVVFGHGPHAWRPITILPSNSGRRGVMFESLGNFIHPDLAPRRQDMIGRVLLDLKTLQLKQVQGIPLTLNGPLASFSGALPANTIPARNLNWRTITEVDWHSGTSESVQGVVANF